MSNKFRLPLFWALAAALLVAPPARGEEADYLIESVVGGSVRLLRDFTPTRNAEAYELPRNQVTFQAPDAAGSAVGWMVEGHIFLRMLTRDAVIQAGPKEIRIKGVRLFESLVPGRGPGAETIHQYDLQISLDSEIIHTLGFSIYNYFNASRVPPFNRDLLVSDFNKVFHEYFALTPGPDSVAHPRAVNP